MAAKSETMEVEKVNEGIVHNEAIDVEASKRSHVPYDVSASEAKEDIGQKILAQHSDEEPPTPRELRQVRWRIDLFMMPLLTWVYMLQFLVSGLHSVTVTAVANSPAA
jgi:hypothetical protein